MELLVGRPEQPHAFYLWLHRVRPGDPIPLLSGRFYGKEGELLLEMERNDLIQNPYGFSRIETRGGWALMDTSLQSILAVEVRAFPNGFLTVLRGELFDATGKRVLRGGDDGLRVWRNASVPFWSPPPEGR
jgi:hypothetical protein